MGRILMTLTTLFWFFIILIILEIIVLLGWCKVSSNADRQSEQFYKDEILKQDINKDRDIIILIKEGKYYFPIFRVQKDEKVSKKITLEKYFSNTGSFEKIVNELKDQLSGCKTPEDIQRTMVAHYKKGMDTAAKKVRFIKYKINYTTHSFKCTTTIVS
jgi:hypothetical protein